MIDRVVATLRRLVARSVTVRAATTMVATVFVAVALAGGALVLLAVLRVTLIGEVEDGARTQAQEVAGQLDAGQPPTLEVAGGDEQLVQVLGPDGAVLASSRNVAGYAAVAALHPRESAQALTPLDDEEFMVVAEAAHTAEGQRTVLVARALLGVYETTAVVTQSMIIGLPVLLVVVALTTWYTVGRALAPVEAIRREVDEISAAELHRRVSQPKVDDEVGRLAATMNRMLGRLEAARNSQRRFVSDASHELRSPLASLREHAEVAIAYPGSTTAVELAEVVLAEEFRMQRLAEDMLVLARADEHAPSPHAPVDLDDLVFEEARRLRANAAVAVDTSAVRAARVFGDVNGLRRLLGNLGDNASRHAASRIEIGLGAGDREVVLTVDDDGPGVPEPERDRVLQRFVRLDDARSRDEGGSGLGLSIVDEVARAHGGSVAILQSPIGGARIEVTLPGGDG